MNFEFEKNICEFRKIQNTQKCIEIVKWDKIIIIKFKKHQNGNIKKWLD